MKNGQIFARKSTARGALDLSYLDETSRRKVSLRARDDMDERIGRALHGFVEYASREGLGQVHAGGFLHDMIRVNSDGTSTAPTHLPNEERKRRITESWQRHLAKFASSAKRPVIAHRLVFSMSTAQHDAFVAAGLNPDQVLHGTMKKIMRRFAERFHPGDAIGFAYGLHHDTENLHAHVALCPRSAKGRYVGCSTSRRAHSPHKNQMAFIRECFAAENERWGRVLSSPERVAETLRKRLDADRLVSMRRLSGAEANALLTSQRHEAQQLHQLYRAIGHLERSLADQRLAAAAQQSARKVGRLFRQRTSKLERVAAQLAGAVSRSPLREQREQLVKLKRRYRALHRSYTHLYGSASSHAHRHAQHASVANQHPDL